MGALRTVGVAADHGDATMMYVSGARPFLPREFAPEPVHAERVLIALTCDCDACSVIEAGGARDENRTRDCAASAPCRHGGGGFQSLPSA